MLFINVLLKPFTEIVGNFMDEDHSAYTNYCSKITDTLETVCES